MQELSVRASTARIPVRRWQFTLAGLMRWVTIIAIFCGAARLIGPNLYVAFYLLFIVFVVFPVLLLIYAWPLLVIAALVLMLQGWALLVSNYMRRMPPRDAVTPDGPDGPQSESATRFAQPGGEPSRPKSPSVTSKLRLQV